MNTHAKITPIDKAPTGAAVAAAIKTDLQNLAETHAPDQDGDWPGTRAKTAYDRLSLKVARELAATALNSEAMALLDAAIACHHAETSSMYDRTIDGDDLADDLETTAQAFGDYTRDVVRHHTGADQ